MTHEQRHDRERLTRAITTELEKPGYSIMRSWIARNGSPTTNNFFFSELVHLVEALLRESPAPQEPEAIQLSTPVE